MYRGGVDYCSQGAVQHPLTNNLPREVEAISYPVNLLDKGGRIPLVSKCSSIDKLRLDGIVSDRVGQSAKHLEIGILNLEKGLGSGRTLTAWTASWNWLSPKTRTAIL